MNIIITGGASGLGRSITEELLKDPTHKFLVSYRTDSATVKSWKEHYPQIEFKLCDFGDRKSVTSFLNDIASFSPDILINNAHTGFEKRHFHKFDDSYALNSFESNVIPSLQITGKCIPIFRKKGGGRIINILSSSIIGNPPIGYSVYTAEKNYLLSMSKSWATENAPFKISSNSISPEFMMTKMTADTDERVVEEMIAGHPLKRLLETSEVAEVVCFLVTCPLHINGINLTINSAKHVI